MRIRRHVTLVYPIYPPLFAFQAQNTVSKRAVCRPYWCELGGGVNIVFVYFGKPFMKVRVPCDHILLINLSSKTLRLHASVSEMWRRT